MPGNKRSEAAVEGQRLARLEAIKAGRQVRVARRRRRVSQESLAIRAGLSRARLAEIEGGDGFHTSLDHWFALARALGIYLRFEFGRDPQAQLRDAGHLDIQELVVRTAGPAGWQAEWESSTGSRWIDVRLVDRPMRRTLIVECWNTFGDLGAAIRSSDYKVTELGDAGLLWVVRDTRANREVVKRYAALIESRFSGSSVGWIKALVVGGPMPRGSGLVWSDVRATRLFARRRAR
jgi:transcriptional regulator with XRE-family HTH domain